MPFGGWLDDYYQDIYCPAIEGAGLEAHRADDLFRPSTIVTDIWAYTKTARLILADLSGKNPNVFYELGLAHALAKPAILVAESMDDVPFDLRALRVLVYDKNAPDWGGLLREKVQNAIGEVLNAPAEAVLPAFLDTKGVAPKPSVTPHEKEILELKQQIDLIREEIRSPQQVRSMIRDIPERSQPINRELPELLNPKEATELIRSYIKRNMPEAMIARRVERLGPPRDWILNEIRRLRGEFNLPLKKR